MLNTQHLLIVVDMQNDFISGTLGSETAQAIVPGVAKKIREHIFQYGPCSVVFTQDTHDQEYLKTQEGQNLPVSHCVLGTWGWELDSRVADALGSSGLGFQKNTFASIEMASYIASKEHFPALCQIEMVGLCTDICVISNALTLKGYLPEIPLIVHEELCAGVTSQSHKNALAAMSACQIRIEP